MFFERLSTVTIQIFGACGISTVTDFVAELVHSPLPPITGVPPVRVYVVPVVGLTLTVLVDTLPAFELHVYVEAPAPDKTTLFPLQRVGVPLIETVGVGVTVTVTTPLPTQTPFASVNV